MRGPDPKPESEKADNSDETQEKHTHDRDGRTTAFDSGPFSDRARCQNCGVFAGYGEDPESCRNCTDDEAESGRLDVV
jgi:ribosomal protein S14